MALPLPSSAFAKTHLVSSYDVGPNQRLTIPKLLSYLHDTAQGHAASLGYGYAHLQPRDLAWALVCIKLQLKNLPEGASAWQATTAVAKHGGPLVYRDYVATQAADVFASGQSLWALIDLKTRKTGQTPPDLKSTILDNTSPLQEDIIGVRRIPRLSGAQPMSEHQVGLHDCDFNGHLNNVVAVRWMLDGVYRLAPTLLDRLETLHVSYHHEALLDQEIQVRAHQNSAQEIYVELVGAGDLLLVNGRFGSSS